MEAQAIAKQATASGISLRVSFKSSVEVCNFIRNKPLARAIGLMESVVRKDMPVPYRRFNKGGVGQRKATGTGRYPTKVCAEIIKLLRSCEANAQSKGLDTSRLVISEIKANKGSKGYHFGRHRGRLMKRTHIDVVLTEGAENEKQRDLAPHLDQSEFFFHRPPRFARYQAHKRVCTSSYRVPPGYPRA